MPTFMEETSQDPSLDEEPPMAAKRGRANFSSWISPSEFIDPSGHP